VPRVTIDCFAESVQQYEPAVTVVATEASRRHNGLLAGELGGQVPYEFDLDNSPVALLSRQDRHRPLILLSTSGTRVVRAASSDHRTYLGCYRNYRGVASALVDDRADVDVVGAGARGTIREEDAQCCAWIAEELVRAGFEAADATTAELIGRWGGTGPEAMLASASVEFLRRTEGTGDLEFILAHVDDLPGTGDLEFILAHVDDLPGTVEVVDGELRYRGVR